MPGEFVGNTAEVGKKMGSLPPKVRWSELTVNLFEGRSIEPIPEPTLEQTVAALCKRAKELRENAAGESERVTSLENLVGELEKRLGELEKQAAHEHIIVRQVAKVANDACDRCNRAFDRLQALELEIHALRAKTAV